MSSPKRRLIRIMALLTASFLLGSIAANYVFAQHTYREPVVARMQMRLQIGDKLVDTIEKGDLLTVLDERKDTYVILTFNGNRGAVEKVNAVKIIESEEIYTDLIKENPTDGRLYTLRAGAWWALKNHKKALDDYDKAIALGYEEPHAYSSRGMFHAAMKNYDEAIADYTTALQRDKEKEDISPLLNRAAVYMTLQKYLEAIADYDRAIKRSPKQPAPYQQRAIAKKLAGKLADAIEDFDKAIALSPKNISAMMGRGFVHFQLGEHDKAVDDFAGVIKLEPRAATAYNNRGFNYQKLGKEEEALADFDKAISLAKDYALAYQNKAWLLVTAKDQKLRNPAAAVKSANKACELNDFSVISDLAAMAAALAADGQFEEAIGWQEKVVDMAPESRKEYSKKVLENYQNEKPFDPSLLEPKAADSGNQDAAELADK